MKSDAHLGLSSSFLLTDSLGSKVFGGGGGGLFWVFFVVFIKFQISAVQ